MCSQAAGRVAVTDWQTAIGGKSVSYDLLAEWLLDSR